MEWTFKKFEELSNKEIWEIYHLRVKVFVVEQTCPYQEVDSFDLEAIHGQLYDQDRLIAYYRLIDTDQEVKLGRVIVHPDYRGQGLGDQLIKEALSVCQDLFANKKVYAQAQAHLEKFYAAHGFKAISEEYLEDNIPHLDMEKPGL